MMMLRFRGGPIACAILLAAAAPAALHAQVGATTDIITGVVTDSAGRPLAEASVEALSLETQITRRQFTDQRGRYTIVFPDGGGQYRMTARLIGMAPHTATVMRQADEDRLVWNVTLGTSVIELEAVTIRGARRPVRAPDLPTPGSTERVITPDNVARLPIDANDLTAPWRWSRASWRSGEPTAPPPPSRSPASAPTPMR